MHSRVCFRAVADFDLHAYHSFVERSTICELLPPTLNTPPTTNNTRNIASDWAFGLFCSRHISASEPCVVNLPAKLGELLNIRRVQIKYKRTRRGLFFFLITRYYKIILITLNDVGQILRPMRHCRSVNDLKNNGITQIVLTELKEFYWISFSCFVGDIFMDNWVILGGYENGLIIDTSVKNHSWTVLYINYTVI